MGVRWILGACASAAVISAAGGNVTARAYGLADSRMPGWRVNPGVQFGVVHESCHGRLGCVVALKSPPTGCQLSVASVYTTDQLMTPLSCSVTWLDTGQTSTIGFRLNVEVSPPSATATPARPPDANGWYNHPVTVGFAGALPASPRVPHADLRRTRHLGHDARGTCTDNAGKVASREPAAELRRDPAEPHGVVAARGRLRQADLAGQRRPGAAAVGSGLPRSRRRAGVPRASCTRVARPRTRTAGCATGRGTHTP